MKTLVVHNKYQQKGGEDTAVERELELLNRNGVKAELFAVTNHQIEDAFQALKTAFNVAYSSKAKEQLKTQIQAFKPDVVHVHNYFPLLSPAVFDACNEAQVPVVHTLHNYRIFCTNGLFLRDGKPCELCLKGNAFQSVAFGCYRDSKLATAAAARMIQTHRNRGTWQTKVNHFIALSEFARDKFIEGGLPADKISIKPNFVNEPNLTGQNQAKKKGSFALYVGRLSPEKGLATLIQAWKSQSLPLHIIGDGPMRAELEATASKNVSFLGALPWPKVSEQMANARFLVSPSECYETFGLTIAEAFAHGLPAVVSSIGSLKELIGNHKTGLLFTPGSAEDLAKKVQALAENEALATEMGALARKAFESRYSATTNFNQLFAIYEKAMYR